MPATREGLAVTERYRRAVIGLRDRTVHLATATWPVVESADHLADAYAAWAARLAGAIVAAQATAALATGAYLAAYMAAETRRAPARSMSIDPDRYAGYTRAGKPVRDAIDLSLGLALRDRERTGGPFRQALEAALKRNVRLGGDEIMAAPRYALHDLMTADPSITGWKRVAAATACPVCLAAADGQTYKVDRLLEIHDHCTCTAEPIITGLPDHAPRPTGSELWAAMTPAEQDAAAGPAAAQAIRDGAPFRSLIAHREMHEQPTQIVQRPAGSLSAA